MIKLVRVYQRVLVRGSSNLWVERRANEQFSLSSWSLCKMSNSLDFSFIRRWKYLISSKPLVIWFTGLSLPKERKFEKKNWACVKKKWKLRLVGTNNCGNFRETQFHFEVSEVRFKNSILEIEVSSASWLKKFDGVLVIVWFFLGFQKVFSRSFQPKSFVGSDK